MIKLDSYFSQIKTKKTEGNVLIFCQIRKKWLQAAPEEVVRQTVVAYLIDQGTPSKHITVEKKITVGKLSRRYDVVVANLKGEYYILVECKAPEVPINQSVVDQAGVYNLTLVGRYIWLTNGHHNKIFEIDHENKTSKEVENIPLHHQ